MTDHQRYFGTDSKSESLLGRLSSEPFALSFSGQGFDWIGTLRDSLDTGVREDVRQIVDAASEIVAPVIDEIVGSRPQGFLPLEWADLAEPATDYSRAAISVPGIFLSQIATLMALEAQGLNAEDTVAVIGHSQGVLGRFLLNDPARAAEALAYAELIGAAATRTALTTGLVSQGDGHAMVMVQGITDQQLVQTIDALFPAETTDIAECPSIGLRNSRDAFVLSGRPAAVKRVCDTLQALSDKDVQQIEAKVRGGRPFSPTFVPLDVEVGFHHPALAPSVELVAEWAEVCGLDTEVARALTQEILIDPVDWVAAVEEAVDLGAKWILEVGPAGGVAALTEEIVVGRGVGVLDISNAEGQAALFDIGRAPAEPLDFAEFAPRVIAGTTPRIETAFTRLTGRSPMLLAGMTPTTVDPEIVAAAANAGHWAELAGGGQVTPEILDANIQKLDQLLEPGINAQFNSMFLDPYLWKMQIGGKRLVRRARANGAPIDGIVITAGMPDHDEAVELIRELRAEGFPWVCFKPGAVSHINKVLAIAADVPDVPVIMQVEGGKAGGHHSWEDLDELLIATYSKIRAHHNVVLCVGGGIGTPERASEYLTGSWAEHYGLPAMPVDGILVGTAAMAAKEAKTSPAVKQLLVDTQGIDAWVGAGQAQNGMASGRSQLGADLHEIDNSFARAGRLLDEVAGDDAAVAERREEIIAAIGQTCKPYFGDLAEMTYEQWLRRYLELSGPIDGEWIDASWERRFTEMIERAEARLTDIDHGLFTPQVEVKGEPTAVVDTLIAAYPNAATDALHPADVTWFLALARTPGKPVNFVPVIDRDVRRWWRSDSLWQAHDPRYSADEVCVIPGPAAVAGITRVDEPIADLLARFNQATIDLLTPEAPKSQSIIERVLNAPGTWWAGRNTTSLIARLGDQSAWVVEGVTASHAPTGATLRQLDEHHAELVVPLAGSTAFGTIADLKIRITVPELPSAVPQVTREDAEAAMSELTRIAAGGTLAAVSDGVATWSTRIDASHVADYANVTAGYLPNTITASGIAPDVLVGRAWPAVFAAVHNAVIPGTKDHRVVEGMLSLVHLEHHITLLRELPEFTDNVLDITATTDEIDDTDIGRIIVVRCKISCDKVPLATLTERFAVRGRTGKSTARTNTSVLPSVVDTPRSFRAFAELTAPINLHPFAVVTGDRNPIHVADNAAALAGLPGVIVHGMWTSAMGELVATGAFADENTTTKAKKVVEYTATMLSPVMPGAKVEFMVERSGVDNRPGCGEVREVTATVDGSPVLTATAVMAAPRTFYAFPGQGIQSQGMGMDAMASSAAARDVWERADRHTRAKLGFSILEIVRNNPEEVVVHGERFFHPQGVLFLTQFTQVAMATLGVAQVAEMREASALNQRAFFAGHSVGEYNALAAYSGVLSLESVVEIVYRRGLTMHRLVDRDANGNSNYALAALRPHKIGVGADEVFDYVARISEDSGEFLEIVNYNLAGLQYAVAGTVAGLAALGKAAEAAAPGQRGLIMIPGIDVPFHSSVLQDGVNDFRTHLDALLPHTVDLDVLVGRYIPNLVARPFELTEDFTQSIAEVVDSPYINDILADFDAAAADEQTLARTLLIELLAWQFASPVRWIETQDLALTKLGVERFVEVGVGSSPTIANMMAQTLRLPAYRDIDIEVLNVERERAIVFASDAIVREVPAAEAEAAEASEPVSIEENQATQNTEATFATAPAPAAGGARPDDIEFTPAHATAMLISLWTKVRPDQMGASDSIETLVEGVSSRRNQLLLDLGVEFGLGAIDGAADAELNDLYATVTRMAKGYTPFGPVLSDAVADSLRRITGPTGKKAGYISERVTGIWQLGSGWASHVTAAVVMGAREGASLRGGELATLSPVSPSSAADLDTLIDAAVAQVAADHGVAVALPSAGGSGGGGVVDSAALGEFAEQVTGKAGVLAATARTILAQLGLDHTPKTADMTGEEADAALFELVSRELGSDWPRMVSQSFDANKAVLLDDRWASAREDLARVALGEDISIDVTGAGEAVARQAEFWGLKDLAAQARSIEGLEFAQEVAVITGASPNSIAAAITAQLLHGGATVVVTTSSLNHKRLTFYKDLYRAYARGKAALWVAPANLNSYTDLDSVIEWIGSEQTATINGEKKVLKPALVPTVLFPFAAPRVTGSLADAGPRAENEMRLLLWAVERLIAGLSEIGVDTQVGRRLHVVLPGSPNRGRFGGDGAYGESKAALDALVTRWHAEPVWGDRTSLVHALIGWVRGTGLMGGNDPLVEAVEAAGVTTFSTDEIAEKLVAQIAPSVRIDAATAPVVVDFTGGLGDADLNLAELARNAAAGASTSTGREEPRSLRALPTPYRRIVQTEPSFTSGVTQKLDDMVVIVGAGELGPLGSSRTRFDAELTGDLTAAGVVELAWTMGLIQWEDGSWIDGDGAEVAECDIYDRFHDEVMARVGVRRYHNDFGMVDNLAPELTTIYLDRDLHFSVADQTTARTFVESEPESTSAWFDEETGEWTVVRRAGSAIRVPRRMAMSRFVGGQIPEGFDPAVYGIPADMIDNLDRVALWNIVCTIDAFLASGFSPAELMRAIHPTRVSSTQGTGMGGMESMRALYVDGLLAEPRQNDILQEALPNVMAAHVMQSYVGGYGQMIHPVAACATAAVSVEEGMDKIRLGKADFVVAGGLDDLSIEGITGFGDMAATAPSAELAAKGIEDRYFSRANDRRRGGFIESAGGGTILLARGSLAADLGLPVLGVVGFAESFADGAHTSIPAPGLGALGAAQGGPDSRLAQAMKAHGVAVDEISVISKHDTSTTANDPNESDLHERMATAMGRDAGNPLFVVSQKTLTGHAKGGAAAFQIIGLTQVLRSGIIPPNRSLDCVDPVLAQHQRLVWLHKPLSFTAKAGLVTSLGFGHVSAIIGVVHPGAFAQALRQERGETAVANWQNTAEQRETNGLRRILNAMHGNGELFERPVDRNLGGSGNKAKEREAAILLDAGARLIDGVLRTSDEIKIDK
ncbi:type I polyketide synthase [Corynebacterium freiburgense]|uniref:type I polyketide synthase n=1 Tax=Corynebacterium freiburgense TaxID=556548 RepID=UPI00047E4923|nr:type I polyketide synthase [Corynebacterium freiburgense]WJZ03491.1 3-oxoacyl-[acyl-carrier-protein] synthase 2 [Corynebacterium freiburgense]